MVPVVLLLLVSYIWNSTPILGNVAHRIWGTWEQLASFSAFVTHV